MRKARNEGKDGKGGHDDDDEPKAPMSEKEMAFMEEKKQTDEKIVKILPFF